MMGLSTFWISPHSLVYSLRSGAWHNVSHVLRRTFYKKISIRGRKDLIVRALLGILAATIASILRVVLAGQISDVGTGRRS